MKIYTHKEITDLMNDYYEAKGKVVSVINYSYGYGLMILTGEKMKTAIVKEREVNPWDELKYTVRFYQKIPKKYEQIIKDIENHNFDYSEIRKSIK